MTAKEQDAKCCGNKPVLGCKDELGRCVVEIYGDGGDWVVYRNDKNVRVWTNNNAVLASDALAQIGVDLAKVERNVYFFDEFDERAPETSGSQDGGHWERQRQSIYALVARSLTLRLAGNGKHAEQAASVMNIAERMASKFIWRRNIGGYLAGAGGATLVFLLAAFYFHGREWTAQTSTASLRLPRWVGSCPC